MSKKSKNRQNDLVGELFYQDDTDIVDSVKDKIESLDSITTVDIVTEKEEIVSIVAETSEIEIVVNNDVSNFISETQEVQKSTNIHEKGGLSWEEIEEHFFPYLEQLEKNSKELHIAQVEEDLSKYIEDESVIAKIANSVVNDLEGQVYDIIKTRVKYAEDINKLVKERDNLLSAVIGLASELGLEIPLTNVVNGNVKNVNLVISTTENYSVDIALKCLLTCMLKFKTWRKNSNELVSKNEKLKQEAQLSHDLYNEARQKNNELERELTELRQNKNAFDIYKNSISSLDDSEPRFLIRHSSKQNCFIGMKDNKTYKPSRPTLNFKRVFGIRRAIKFTSLEEAENLLNRLNKYSTSIKNIKRYTINQFVLKDIE